MSEKILIQKAARAIVSCAKSVGTMDVAALNTLNRIAQRVASQDGQDYERFKQLLPEQFNGVAFTPVNVNREFDKTRATLFESAKKSGVKISPESDLISLLSLQSNPLGQYVTESDLLPLMQGSSWESVGQIILNSASDRMSEQNCRDILAITVDAVKAEGFTKSNTQAKTGRAHYLSYNDADGKGVIVTAEPGSNGTSLSLDLTGFSDGSCHKKIQNLIERLKNKGIVFENIERKCHSAVEEDLRVPVPIAKPLKAPTSNTSKLNIDELRRRQRTQNNSTLRQVNK